MGRTAYMDGIRSAYKCFTGNSEENRSLGRLGVAGSIILKFV
jgi:hypothetical protein